MVLINTNGATSNAIIIHLYINYLSKNLRLNIYIKMSSRKIFDLSFIYKSLTKRSSIHHLYINH